MCELHARPRPSPHLCLLDSFRLQLMTVVAPPRLGTRSLMLSHLPGRTVSSMTVPSAAG